MDQTRQPDLANRPKPAARARAGRVPNLGLLAWSRQKRVTELSIVVSGDAPPNEFRVFTAGKVETSKGVFTFDDVAAKSVMADYATQGNELMVDYDHASLAGISLDPAQAGKAAGWFNLEVRNGELWAVNVRWTQPAAAQLSAKEWRYMSPAFQTDESGRITSLLNVALTNIPATRKLDPLMAASMLTTLGAQGMDPAQIKKALDAIEAGDSAAALEILKGLIASAAGADPDATTEDAPPPVGDGGADENQEMGGAPPPGDPKKEDKPAEVAAALSAVASLTGKSSLVASIADIREAFAARDREVEMLASVAKREAVLEAAERRKLCVELVSLGGRAPATVWADDAATAPKPYLATMPIADLRAMHADTIKANGGKQTPKPPVAKLGAVGKPVSSQSAAGSKEYVVDGGAVITLSALDHQYAKDANCPPEVYATLKARREAAKNV